MYLLTTFAYKPLNDKKLNTIYQKRQSITDRIGKGSNKYTNKITDQTTDASRSILNDIFNHNKTPVEAKNNLLKKTNESKKLLLSDLDRATKLIKNRVKQLDTVSNMYKPKSKLLTGKNLAITGGSLVAASLLGSAINKLRKSRKDKGKLRGKYRN